MSDFAKNLFGFSKGSGAELGPVKAASATPKDFPSGILPRTSTPTTALSDSSFAFGTTIKGAPVADHVVLKSRFGFTQQQQQQQQQSNLTAQLQTKPTNENASRENSRLSSDGSTVDETRTQSNTSSAESAAGAGGVPRGKLRINIIEAVGLNVLSGGAQPYVVCTFEGSESFCAGPEGFGKSQKEASSQPRQQAQEIAIDGRSASHHSSMNIHHQDRHSEDTDNPIWNHQAIFDVVGHTSEVDVAVYDRAEQGFFLGHVRIRPRTDTENKTEGWYKLRSRASSEVVTGKIRIKFEYTSISKRHYTPDDFDVIRMLGKGTFGQVYLVAKRDTKRVYAMKVLSKQVIVKKKEVAHTIGERNIMVRTSGSNAAFIVGLKFSFQTPDSLYLVTDYMSGGELFWHLQREGRFSEDRARFYIAELVVALEHLHDNGIVYRDLKPENILLDANGHIALCDFGLSKADLYADRTTNTFCGTTEYLAPEVLLDESGYTKMVDFWSLGVLIFEMCCGWSPFYAENTQQMYKNIAFGKVRFPKEVLSPEGRSFVKGLLNRNPLHRLGAIDDARELKAHPFFRDINWKKLCDKKVPTPFVPKVANQLDTSNFDPEFTNTSTSVMNKQMQMGTTPLSEAIQDKFKGFTYVDDSTMFDHLNSLSVKRGNSMKPKYGSFIPANPSLPPEEEVIQEEDYSDFDEEDEADDMDVDDDFVNGPFDL